MCEFGSVFGIAHSPLYFLATSPVSKLSVPLCSHNYDCGSKVGTS